MTVDVYAVVDEIDRLVGVFATQEEATRAAEDHIASDAPHSWYLRHLRIPLKVTDASAKADDDEAPDAGARCTLCGERAIVLVYLPEGCQAVNWQYQWLCPQHELSMTPVAGCEYLVDYRPPADW